MSSENATERENVVYPSLLRRGFALLNAREKRSAFIVLIIIALSAISAAAMVGSVLPFLTVLSNPSQISEVSALQRAYSYFGFTSEYSFLVALGLVSIVVILIANAMQMLRIYSITRFSMMRVHSVSHRLLSQYLHQPYEYFLTAHTGDMSSKLLNETNQFMQYFLRPLADVVASGMTVIMVLAVVFWIDPLVSSIAFGGIGGGYLLAFIVSRGHLATFGVRRAEANSMRFRIATESLSGIKDIKLLDREKAFLDRYGEQSLTMASMQVAMTILTQMPRYALQTLAFCGVIVLCLVLLVPSDRTSESILGEILPLLGVFALAGQRLMPELGSLYQGLGQLSYGRGAVDAVYNDHLTLSKNFDEDVKLEAPLHLRNSLFLKDIEYRYPGNGRSALLGVSLSIRAGERIGIVGGSGAGKTTLADLILGLLQPTSGTMSVDGMAVTSDKLPNWRQSVGYVPQDIFLLDASVAENIALGVVRSEIDLEKVEAAGRLAQINGFVRDELSQGYDTPIGERGKRLSGGQRQRIGIARALYREADLILFDEATSALDNLTEKEVLAAIDNLPGSKTVVMIAHRLTTVRRCDRILVLDEGSVAGFDTWDRLMNQNEIFKRLATLQATRADLPDNRPNATDS